MCSRLVNWFNTRRVSTLSGTGAKGVSSGAVEGVRKEKRGSARRERRRAETQNGCENGSRKEEESLAINAE